MSTIIFVDSTKEVNQLCLLCGDNMDQETKYKLTLIVEDCLKDGMDLDEIKAMYIDAMSNEQIIDHDAERQHYNNEFDQFADRVDKEDIDLLIEKYLKNLQ